MSKRPDSTSDDLVAGGTGVVGEALKKRRGAVESSALDEQRLLSGEAWADFCEAVRRAGITIARANPGAPPRDRAAGYRYLTGLVNAAIRFSVDFADPMVPRFFRSPDTRTPWGGENADNQYMLAGVSADASYRLTGTRGTAFELLIEVKEGFMQLGDDRVFETVSAADLEFGVDGDIEILFSRERPATWRGNWIPMHPETKLIVIRQYFVDWEREIPATFHLERIGDEGTPPTPLSAARMGALLREAGAWVEVSARLWNEWVERIRADYRPGRVVPAVKYVGGADTIRYGNDYYRLAEGYAMIIETEVPNARYWAFQLCGLWFEGRDYGNRQTSINHHQARIDGDGRFRCVLAHEDPGVANWLDTAGHTEGLLQYRWVWTEDSPEPTCKTVKLAELGQHLRPDTARVTREGRARAIAMRRRHIARREP